MILPEFIAVRAYLESSGTAFANKDYIMKLFQTLLERKEITVEEGKDILGHKTNTPTSIFKLFQHLGIIAKRYNEYDKLNNYSFSKIGRDILISDNLECD